MNKGGWLTKAFLSAGVLLGLLGSPALADGVFTQPTTSSWWLPPNASVHGEKIDAIFTLIFVITVAVMILVFVFLIYLLIKYRYQAGRKVVYIHGNHKLEVIWTLAPAVVLVVMGVLSLRVWADVSMNPPDPAREDVTEVEILAQQFQWNVRYPGKDHRFGTADDIYTFDVDHPAKSVAPGVINVPVDKPVKIYLLSRDVLHSFFLPHMRMKRDAVPGLRGVIYFTPTKTGRFDLACAELCGPQHYSMSGVFVVQSQADYDTWLADRYLEVEEQMPQTETPVEPATEPSAEGQPADAPAAEPQEGAASEPANESAPTEPTESKPAETDQTK